MKLVRKNPDRFPSAFDELFNTDWLGGVSTVNRIGVTIPAANITEDDDAFVIALAIPGFNKEDIAIELDNDTLTITSEKEVNETSKDNEYTRKEFEYSTFKRAFNLPESVDQTAIEAQYEAGVITVTIPKKEEAKVQPKRNIAIA